MAEKFEKERNEILNLLKGGISGNLNLSAKQKKYVKNLLLFALMNASKNETVLKKNFNKLVNKLFKDSLIKILRDNADDDDDEDFEETLSVELNRILADADLAKNLEQVLTPEIINDFLVKSTPGVSRAEMVKKIMALREVKTNYRETPKERAKRERNRREYELAKVRQRMMDNSRSYGRS